MLIHTTYSCYRKSSEPIRKGFTAKDRYDRAITQEQKEYDNKTKRERKLYHKRPKSDRVTKNYIRR